MWAADFFDVFRAAATVHPYRYSLTRMSTLSNSVQRKSEKIAEVPSISILCFAGYCVLFFFFHSSFYSSPLPSLLLPSILLYCLSISFLPFLPSIFPSCHSTAASSFVLPTTISSRLLPSPPAVTNQTCSPSTNLLAVDYPLSL